MIKVLLLVSCALVLFISDAEGGCGCGCGCGCGRRRRDAPEEYVRSYKNFDDADYGRLSLPNKLSDYDKNEDGHISYDEFKEVMPPVKNIKQIQEMFNFIDKNGDKYIDCKEFLSSNIYTGGKKLAC